VPVAIPIFQAPGSNALELSTAVRGTMAKLKQNFPQGVDYTIVYDPTVFVRQSIEAVVRTLLERVAGRPRRHPVPADLARLDHPLVAVPVSIIGAFACCSRSLLHQ